MPAVVKPADGFVAFKPVRPKPIVNGLLVVEKLDTTPQFGRVLAVGLGREVVSEGKLMRMSMPYQVGDIIRVNAAAIVSPEVGKEYGVCGAQDIIATIEGFVEHDEEDFTFSKALDDANRNTRKGPGLVVPQGVPPQLVNGRSPRR